MFFFFCRSSSSLDRWENSCIFSVVVGAFTHSLNSIMSKKILGKKIDLFFWLDYKTKQWKREREREIKANSITIHWIIKAHLAEKKIWWQCSKLFSHSFIHAGRQAEKKNFHHVLVVSDSIEFLLSNEWEKKNIFRFTSIWCLMVMS